MAYAGLVKRAKSHFENCNDGPEETLVQGDCSYILTPRAKGAARPSPAGPECKKNYMNLKGKWKYLFHNKVFFCCFFHICRCSTCEGVTRGQPRPIDLKSSFILSYLNSDMGQVSPGICQYVK